MSTAASSSDPSKREQLTELYAQQAQEQQAAEEQARAASRANATITFRGNEIDIPAAEESPRRGRLQAEYSAALLKAAARCGKRKDGKKKDVRYEPEGLTKKTLTASVSDTYEYLQSTFGALGDAPAAGSLRNFCSACIELIVADVAFARAKRLDALMWSTFYKQISALQQQVQAQTKQAAAAQAAAEGVAPLHPAQLAEQTAELHGTRARLGAILREATRAYSALLQQLCNSVEIAVDAPFADAASSDGSWACSSCLIALGDLARYQEKATARRPRSWSHARFCYEQALRARSSNGKVHNQLGVLAQSAGSELDALYCFVRARFAYSPFAAKGCSADNLAILLHGARKRAQSDLGDYEFRLGINASIPLAQKVFALRLQVLVSVFIDGETGLDGPFSFEDFASAQPAPASTQLAASAGERLELMRGACLGYFRMLLLAEAFDERHLVRVLATLMSLVTHARTHPAHAANPNTEACAIATLLTFAASVARVGSADPSGEHGFRMLRPICVAVDWLDANESWMQERAAQVRSCTTGGDVEAAWAEMHSALCALVSGSMTLFTEVQRTHLDQDEGMLPEDSELFGFQPLASAILPRTQHGKVVSDSERHAERANRLRVQRLAEYFATHKLGSIMLDDARPDYGGTAAEEGGGGGAEEVESWEQFNVL